MFKTYTSQNNTENMYTGVTVSVFWCYGKVGLWKCRLNIFFGTSGMTTLNGTKIRYFWSWSNGVNIFMLPFKKIFYIPWVPMVFSSCPIIFYHMCLPLFYRDITTALNWKGLCLQILKIYWTGVLRVVLIKIIEDHWRLGHWPEVSFIFFIDKLF